MLLKLAASTIPLAAGLSHLVKKAGNPYVVQPRDTLGGLSKRFNVSERDLARWNNLQNPNMIRVGQRLYTSAPQPPNARPARPVAPVRAPAAVAPAVPRTPDTLPPAASRAAFPLKNNNPGNMRFYNIGWQGELATGLKSGDFTNFKTPQYGLRAMIRNMRTISRRAGGATLDKMIPHYSPASENNTDQHIRNIAAFSGIPRNKPIDFNNDEMVANLARGLMRAESGKSVADWFTPQEVLDAVRGSRRSS